MSSILVADDAGFMRMVLKELLSHEGYEILEAVDGNDVVRRFKEYSPDLVIMDITMPNKNGIDALRDIKKIDPKAKVIMCSAMGQIPIIVTAVQEGALDFIVKPFQKEKVIDVVSRVINR